MKIVARAQDLTLRWALPMLIACLGIVTTVAGVLQTGGGPPASRYELRADVQWWFWLVEATLLVVLLPRAVRTLEELTRRVRGQVAASPSDDPSRGFWVGLCVSMICGVAWFSLALRPPREGVEPWFRDAWAVLILYGVFCLLVFAVVGPLLLTLVGRSLSRLAAAVRALDEGERCRARVHAPELDGVDDYLGLSAGANVTLMLAACAWPMGLLLLVRPETLGFPSGPARVAYKGALVASYVCACAGAFLPLLLVRRAVRAIRAASLHELLQCESELVAKLLEPADKPTLEVVQLRLKLIAERIEQVRKKSSWPPQIRALGVLGAAHLVPLLNAGSVKEHMSQFMAAWARFFSA